MMRVNCVIGICKKAGASFQAARWAWRWAFAELRAEVAATRRAVEGLQAVVETLVAPDYAPSFGAIVKALGAVEARLLEIEAHPALQLMPEQHGRAISRAGADVLGAAAKVLRDEAEAAKRERQALERIVGAEPRGAEAGAALGARSRRGRRLRAVSLLGAFAPGGSRLAAWASGHFDRWQAGSNSCRRRTRPARRRSARPRGWSTPTPRRCKRARTQRGRPVGSRNARSSWRRQGCGGMAETVITPRARVPSDASRLSVGRSRSARASPPLERPTRSNGSRPALRGRAACRGDRRASPPRGA